MEEDIHAVYLGTDHETFMTHIICIRELQAIRDGVWIVEIDFAGESKSCERKRCSCRISLILIRSS